MTRLRLAVIDASR
ncbi:MAG: hypothetical protein K9G27_02190 [Sphingomonadaceae bacterium]|nr:hypothetical protein [Sphingomonadaceae bacterium]